MKMLLSCCLLVVWGTTVILAGVLPEVGEHHRAGPVGYNDRLPEVVHENSHTPFAYYGHYGGACGNDGFYYKDHASFIICSNGNAYEQPCAPGSLNSAHGRYTQGSHYYYRDFCDVNLVDNGAGIPRHHHGYGGVHSNGYEGAAVVAEVPVYEGARRRPAY